MQTESMAAREQNWLFTIRQAAESGVTAKQWCAEHSVAESTFYRWKQRLQSELPAQADTPLTQEAPAQDPVCFARLALPQTPEPATEPQPEFPAPLTAPLRIRSGHLTLELPAQTGEAELAKILRAVRDAW